MGFLVDNGIRVLCLDIDGTLYPKRMLNIRMVRSSFPSLRLALAFNWARQEYRRIQDDQKPKSFDREGLLDLQACLVASRLGKVQDETTLKRIKAAIEKQFYKSWERSFCSIKPYSDLRSALLAAKGEGLRIAVFSDFPLVHKLGTLGIADLVDVAYSSEESGFLKPSLNSFAYLLEKLVEQPERILFVGDSYSKDCCGAKKAGMHSCLLTKKRNTIYPEADLVVGSWKEFASLVL